MNYKRRKIKKDMKYVGNKEENVEYRKRPGAYAITERKEDKK